MSYRNPAMVRDTASAEWAKVGKAFGSIGPSYLAAKKAYQEKERKEVDALAKQEQVLSNRYRISYNKNINDNYTKLLKDADGNKMQISLADQWRDEQLKLGNEAIKYSTALSLNTNLDSETRDQYTNFINDFDKNLGKTAVALGDFQGYMQPLLDGDFDLQNSTLTGSTLLEKLQNAAFAFSQGTVPMDPKQVLTQDIKYNKNDVSGNLDAIINSSTLIPLNSEFFNELKTADPTGDFSMNEEMALQNKVLVNANGSAWSEGDGEKYVKLARSFNVNNVGVGDNVVFSPVGDPLDYNKTLGNANIIVDKNNIKNIRSLDGQSTAALNDFNKEFTLDKTVKRLKGSASGKASIETTNTQYFNVGKMAEATDEVFMGEAASMLAMDQSKFNATMERNYGRVKWFLQDGKIKEFTDEDGDGKDDTYGVSAMNNIHKGIMNIADVDVRKRTLADILRNQTFYTADYERKIYDPNTDADKVEGLTNIYGGQYKEGDTIFFYNSKSTSKELSGDRLKLFQSIDKGEEYVSGPGIDTVFKLSNGKYKEQVGVTVYMVDGKETTFQKWKEAKNDSLLKLKTSQTKIYKDKKDTESRTPNEVLEYFLVDTENLTI